MKKLLSLVVWIVVLFSFAWVNAMLTTPVKVHYWQFVWEVQEDAYSTKTIFLLLDQNWNLFRVFSSRLAQHIRNLYLDNAKVKVTGQDYFTSNGYYAGIYVKNIDWIQKIEPNEYLKSIVDDLNEAENVLAYVYSKISSPNELNKLSSIFWWNNVSYVASQMEDRFNSWDVNLDLYRLVKTLFEDSQLNNGSVEYCEIANWKKIFENLNPELKTLITTYNDYEIEDIIDWNNIDNDNKEYLYEILKDMNNLKSYLSLRSEINSLDKELYEVWNLDHYIEILSGVSWFELNINKLKYLVDNNVYIAEIVNSFEWLSWISKKAYLKYVLAKMKNYSIRAGKCKLDDNSNTQYLELLNKGYNKVFSDAYARDSFKKAVEPFELIYFENFNVFNIDLSWDKLIKIYPGNSYDNNFSIHINLKAERSSNPWEYCEKTSDMMYSWLIWMKYSCFSNFDNLSKIWYYWEKILRVLSYNDKVIEIYYYKTNTALDDLFEDLISRININK